MTMPDKCLIDPERDCLGIAAAGKLELRIEHLEQEQQKESAFREAYYTEQRERIRRDATLDAKMSEMDGKLDRLLEWQEEQKDKPGKRWEGIVDKIIGLVVGAVVGFLLMRAGL